jgi:hypothetical protein
MDMAQKANVRAYLLMYRGVKPDRVEALLEKGADLITKGQRLMSGAYYVANQICNEYATDDDFTPGFIPPEGDEEEDDN